MSPWAPLDAIFPPTCLLCGAPGMRGIDLCSGCAAELPANRPCCPRCALPMDSALPAGTVCGACQRRPPAFDLCIAPLRYQGPLPHLVGEAKFRGRLAAARLLGLLLADGALALDPPRPQVLIPVPLHARRLAERGYNQALEMARGPADALGLPLDTRVCTRVAATRPQTGLDLAERRRNLRGAFAVASPLPWDHVALVDDVVTSGSTVAELARVLRRAGARRVDVWAVARTP